MWFVLTLSSALLWAAASLVDKLAVNWGYRSLEILPTTYLAGFIVIIWNQSYTSDIWQLQYIISGGILAFFSLLNAFALLMALRCGDVALVSVVAGSHCIITAISAAILLRESMGLREWMAIAMAVVGLLLVFGISEGLVRDRYRPRQGYRWFWLALLAGIGSSGETLAIKYATELSVGARHSLIWEYFLGTIACYLLVRHQRVKLRLNPALFGVMDGALTGLGMVTFGYALAMGPASLVAVVATAAVLFRALGGIIFFGDRAGRRQWLGFGMLFTAFVLIRL